MREHQSLPLNHGHWLLILSHAASAIHHCSGCSCRCRRLMEPLVVAGELASCHPNDPVVLVIVTTDWTQWAERREQAAVGPRV